MFKSNFFLISTESVFVNLAKEVQDSRKGDHGKGVLLILLEGPSSVLLLVTETIHEPVEDCQVLFADPYPKCAVASDYMDFNKTQLRGGLK